MAQKVPHSFIVYLYGREFQNELSFRMLQYAEKIQLQRNTGNSKLMVHKKKMKVNNLRSVYTPYECNHRCLACYTQ